MKPIAEPSLPMYYSERSGSELPVIVINDERGIVTNNTIPFLHCHDSLEIVWCREGSLTFRVEQQELKLHANEICTIGPDRMHMSYITGKMPAVCNYMFIDLRRIRERFSVQTFPWHLLHYKKDGGAVVLADTDIPTLFSNIVNELDHKELYYQGKIMAYIYLLITELLRRSDFSAVPDEFDQQSHFPIQITLDYIKENYMNDITIPELANMCHISENYYRSLFNKMTGENPINYLNRIRVENACDLLFRTSLPIQEICNQVGFRTLSSLNRYFKRFTGVAPREWRLDAQQRNLPHPSSKSDT